MKYPKGTKLVWKDTGLPAYEKVSNDDFSWWSSMKDTELEKPMFRKDGTLNRYGFKWTDKQVYNFYSEMMIIDEVE